MKELINETIAVLTSKAGHLGWQHMPSNTKWHLWHQNTIQLMHHDHLVGNRYFVPFFVFYTESVKLGPCFRPESVSLCQPQPIAKTSRDSWVWWPIFLSSSKTCLRRVLHSASYSRNWLVSNRLSISERSGSQLGETNEAWDDGKEESPSPPPLAHGSLIKMINETMRKDWGRVSSRKMLNGPGDN